MGNGKVNEDFDSLSYWRGRHDKYLTDPTGVGNTSLDIEANRKIYSAMDAYVGSFAESLKLVPEPKCLDLGCGIGLLAGAFLRAGYQYLGVDISETATEIARAKYPSARFQVGNIAKLDLHDTFDLIIERTVFIHLVEYQYWISVLREIKRLLAPTGVFVIIDQLPTSDQDTPASSTHVKFRRYQEYVAQFEGLGLAFNAQVRDQVAKRVNLSPHTHFVTHLA